jgi:hypothetical protein
MFKKRAICVYMVAIGFHGGGQGLTNSFLEH